MKDKIKGLVAAPHAPMTADGKTAPKKVARLKAALIRSSVSGAFVNGTTGESMSLTVQERIELAERWVRDGDRKWPVIVHVGHHCLDDARELAAHADSIRAHGIALTSPSYYKPAALDDLIAFCSEVAEAAPETPFFYYHIPSVTGVNFRMSEMLRLAAPHIPTLQGMKYTHNDMTDLTECLALDDGKWEILFGMDEIMLAAAAFGVTGFVGSTYNYCAPLYVEILRRFGSGDVAGARSLQTLSMRMVRLWDKYKGSNAGKAMMAMVGEDCGPPRLPQRALSEADAADLRSRLEAIGFFEWANKPAE